MTNSNVTKCPECFKVFFDYLNTEICPFCKCNVRKTQNEKFKHMFGENNPLNDIFGKL